MADPKTNPGDRLPPRVDVDYERSAPRSSCAIMAPRLRAHETVLVAPTRELPIADMARRAKAENDGGQVLANAIRELQTRRIRTGQLRKNGGRDVDHEAEAFSFRSIGDLSALKERMRFDVTVQVPDGRGGARNMTTDAFALLTSSLAHTDMVMAAEAVPTVSEQLVQDTDDKQPNTEIPELLDFKMTDPTQMPKPLGETEDYKLVGAGEDRYTILNFRDGYRRIFTQELLDLGGPQVFSDLVDLSQGSIEVMEIFVLRKIIDFFGSKASGAGHHAMIRNRAAAALFSATANTPSTRTPSGTRIENNALEDGSDIENLRVRLTGMRNSRGYPANAQLKVILIPDALWMKAWNILQSQTTPGVFGEANFYGPNGPVRPLLISTPMLDLLTSTAWYGGDPQRQFVRKWRKRPEVAVHGGKGTEPYVRNGQAMHVSLSWDMDIGVRGHTHWVENLAGNTAPGDA